MSKAGMTFMTKTLSQKHGSRGVRFNEVATGLCEGKMIMGNLSTDVAKHIVASKTKKNIPLRKLMNNLMQLLSGLLMKLPHH